MATMTAQPGRTRTLVGPDDRYPITSQELDAYAAKHPRIRSELRELGQTLLKVTGRPQGLLAAADHVTTTGQQYERMGSRLEEAATIARSWTGDASGGYQKKLDEGKAWLTTQKPRAEQLAGTLRTAAGHLQEARRAAAAIMQRLIDRTAGFEGQAKAMWPQYAQNGGVAAMDAAIRKQIDALMVDLRRDAAAVETQLGGRLKEISGRFAEVTNGVGCPSLANSAMSTLIYARLPNAITGGRPIGGIVRYTQAPDGRYFALFGAGYMDGDPGALVRVGNRGVPAVGEPGHTYVGIATGTGSSFNSGASGGIDLGAQLDVTGLVTTGSLDGNVSAFTQLYANGKTVPGFHQFGTAYTYDWTLKDGSFQPGEVGGPYWYTDVILRESGPNGLNDGPGWNYVTPYVAFSGQTGDNPTAEALTNMGLVKMGKGLVVTNYADLSAALANGDIYANRQYATSDVGILVPGNELNPAPHQLTAQERLSYATGELYARVQVMQNEETADWGRDQFWDGWDRVKRGLAHPPWAPPRR